MCVFLVDFVDIFFKENMPNFGEHKKLGTIFGRHRWVSQARRSSLMQALTQRKAGNG